MLEKLRQDLRQKTRKETLCYASGITDDRVLEALLAVDIDAESLTAISLVPLVVVVWADGSSAAKERSAILKAAETEGSDQVSYQLLERWLEEQPSNELLTAWKDFVQVVTESFPADALATFRDDVVGRAGKIAKVAGGILGVGSQSATELAAIEDLEATFSS